VANIPDNKITGLPIVLLPYLLYGIRSIPNIKWSSVWYSYILSGYPLALIFSHFEYKNNNIGLVVFNNHAIKTFYAIHYFKAWLIFRDLYKYD